MTVIVDDHVLSAELRGRRLVDGPVHTTGLWYLRLCQVVLRSRGGMLSAPYADLPPQLRERALASVLQLPADIGLLSLRELAPAMGQLAARHQLNVLAREALAAALALEATLVLSNRNENPRLVRAAAAEGVPVSIVAAA